jgi:uncharacterized protein (DUF488 family)
MRLWTIGHSVLSAEEFLALLKAHEIRLLADIRRYPASRRLPHFNGDALAAFLAEAGIAYRHFPELGGRRAARADSRNTLWRNASFRGYADYMESEDFQRGFEALENAALAAPTAIMCSEAVWWKCHRMLVADALTARGMEVAHILGPEPARLHFLTKGAKIRNGYVDYSKEPEIRLL